MRIIAEKTVLTTFIDSDITDIYIGWLNDKNLMKYSNQRFFHHDLSSCSEYLQSFSGTTNSFLKISDRRSGVMIGTLTIYRNIFHGTADIGILIGDSNFSSKGYGFDAWSSVLNHLLYKEGTRKVTAGANELNLSMINLMIKSGMYLEATKFNQEIVDGCFTSLVFYARYSK